MNYLSGAETSANVAVLWVVSRWLRQVGQGSYASLVASLRPAAVVKGEENAFLASLLVGRHIGVLKALDESGPGPSVHGYRKTQSTTTDCSDAQSGRPSSSRRSTIPLPEGSPRMLRLDLLGSAALTRNDHQCGDGTMGRNRS